MLAALLPERAVHAGAKVTTAAIRSGCERVLAAAIEAGLGCCIVDDLHCADAASLELLQHLMLADARCRWALARRPEQGDAAADALADALAGVHRLVVVRLAPLDEATLAELLESLALPQLAGEPLAVSLARHTGGNPLFVLETLKQIVLAGGRDAGARLPRPLGVIEAIERRLGGLSAPAQSLVQLAAVAGADFSVTLAEAVLHTPALSLADAWRELEAAQLIDGDAFVHDLVHEAVLGWVPQPIRRHLCGSIAGVLAHGGGDPARLAELWLAAGDDAQAAPALVAAADAARRAGRYIEAGQRSEQAARAYDRCGRDAQAFEQLYRAFDDRSTTASLVEQQPLADEIDRRARGDAQAAMAAITRAHIANMRCDWVAMEAALEAALAAATRCGDGAIEAEASFGLGLLHYSRGEFAEAVEQIGAAAARLDAVGLRLREAEVRGSLARVFHLLGRVAEARTQLDIAIPVLRDAHAGPELARDVSFQALLALEAGEPVEALELSRQSYRLLGDAQAGLRDWLTVVGDRLQVLATANRYGGGARADRRRARRSALRADAVAGTPDRMRGRHPVRTRPRLAGRAPARAARRDRRRHGRLPRLARGAGAAGAVAAGAPASRGKTRPCAPDAVRRAATLPLCSAGRSASTRARGAAVVRVVPRAGGKPRPEGPPACAAGQPRRCVAAHPAAGRGPALRTARLAPAGADGAARLSWRRLAAAAPRARGGRRRRAAREVLLQAGEWLHHTARRFVPPEFRDSFLSRNAVNRELLLLAARATIAPAR